MVSMANWTLQSWPRLSQRKPNLMVQVSYTYFKQISQDLCHPKIHLYCLFALVNNQSIDEEFLAFWLFRDYDFKLDGCLFSG